MKKIGMLILLSLFPLNHCTRASHDPKTITICVTGGAATLLGLYTIYKGLGQSFGELKNPSTSCFSELFTRCGGIIIAGIGCMFTSIGLTGILSSDALTQYINDETFKFRCQRWIDDILGK